MKLLDDKFLRNKTRYVVQCALATAATMIVLMGLHAIASQAVIGALGATAFIVFTMPGRQVSRTRYLVGGYIIGICSGAACYWLSRALISCVRPETVHEQLTILAFAAAAVGLAIFMMVVTNSEHPPAGGVALGIVLGDWHQQTIIFVLAGVLALSALRRILRPLLIDLL